MSGLLQPTLQDHVPRTYAGSSRPWRTGSQIYVAILGGPVAVTAIALTADSELVLRTLGEHMFNRYVEIKRREWEDYRVQVSQWELDRYLPVL